MSGNDKKLGVLNGQAEAVGMLSGSEGIQILHQRIKAVFWQ